jgi:uncharacterized protein (TIGR03084 family)
MEGAMMSVTLPELLADLAAETRAVDDLLAVLTSAQWELETPAKGWAIRDQVSHLAFFDESAVLAATEPDRFRIEAAELLALGPSFPDEVATRYRQLPSEELTHWFRSARADLLRVFAGLDGKTRAPWFGPDMSVTSSATARLMETWAHGQDIADTLGVARPATARLRHIAHLGVRTIGFSFGLHRRPVPDAGVRVELAAPGGGRWSWGDEASVNTVTGPAVDFCLVVTQRRHPADTALRVAGAVAAEWLSIAQAFAGAPGTGREPGRFGVREIA